VSGKSVLVCPKDPAKGTVAAVSFNIDRELGSSGHWDGLQWPGRAVLGWSGQRRWQLLTSL